MVYGVGDVRGTTTPGAAVGIAGTMGVSGVFGLAATGVLPVGVWRRRRRRELAFCSSEYSNGGRSSVAASSVTGVLGSAATAEVSSVEAGETGWAGVVCSLPFCPWRRRPWSGTVVIVVLSPSV